MLFVLALASPRPAAAADGVAGVVDVEPAPPSPVDTLTRPAVDATRFAVEVGTVYVLAVAWYIQNIEVNKKDWDWPDWEQRLLTFEAVRLDNNSFLFNQWYHPLDGGLYYLTARTNGLGVLGSALTTLAMSTGWEFFIEFPEMVSLNDLIITPGAGISIGESYHQIGSWLTSGGAVGDALGHDVVSWSLAPLHTLHAWLDDTPGSAQVYGHDHLGLSREWWHDGELSVAAMTRVGEAARSATQVGLETRLRLVRLPRFRRAGRAGQWFWAGNLTDVSLRVVADDADVQDLSLSTRAVLAGRYDQRLHGAGDRLDSGHVLVAGLATAYDVAETQLEEAADRRAMLHLIGATLEVRGQLTSWLATGLGIDIFFDVAALHSLAWDDWRRAHPTATASSILEEQGYLFATGGTVRGRLEVELDAVELRAWLGWGRWSMINGLDRFQDRITDDVGGRDEVIEWGARARVLLTHAPGMSLFTAIEGLTHTSELGVLSDQDSLVRASVGTGLEF